MYPATSTRAPSIISSNERLDREPYCKKAREITHALTGIGMICDQRFDHVDDFSNMVRRLGYDIWRAHTQGGHILLVFLRIAIGKSLNILAITGGRGVDLVINVRDVTDVTDLGVTHAQQARQHVITRAGRYQCGQSCNRSADINRYVLRLDGTNKAFAGQRTEDDFIVMCVSPVSKLWIRAAAKLHGSPSTTTLSPRTSR